LIGYNPPRAVEAAIITKNPSEFFGNLI